MSADNGIYILPVKSKTPSGEKTIYYVRHQSAIENLWSDPDREDGLNSEELEAFMQHSVYYDSLIEAESEAQQMLENLYICEYGVVKLETIYV